MNTKGFTLTELLVTVVILGVLVSVALPQYMRAVERSRATEAMSVIKSINDAIYVYYSDKEECPAHFSQLAVTLPAGTISSNLVKGKHFEFRLGNAETAPVPGTNCQGVLATRAGTSDYQYIIFNPFSGTGASKALSLICIPTAASGTDSFNKSLAICESLGLYRAPATE